MINLDLQDLQNKFDALELGKNELDRRIEEIKRSITQSVRQSMDNDKGEHPTFLRSVQIVKNPYEEVEMIMDIKKNHSDNIGRIWFSEGNREIKIYLPTGEVAVFKMVQRDI